MSERWARCNTCNGQASVPDYDRPIEDEKENKLFLIRIAGETYFVRFHGYHAIECGGCNGTGFSADAILDYPYVG